MLNRMKLYLAGMIQCVRVGSETTPVLSIEMRVPQGSILGPRLICAVVVKSFQTLKEHVYHGFLEFQWFPCKYQNNEQLLNSVQQWQMWLSCTLHPRLIIDAVLTLKELIRSIKCIFWVQWKLSFYWNEWFQWIISSEKHTVFTKRLFTGEYRGQIESVVTSPEA